MLRIATLLLAFIVFATGTAAAAAPKVITKVPATITKPGNYVVSSSLKYKGDGAAITINTDNVTLDLRGNAIIADREISKVSETAGVFAHSRLNITIRNGRFEGFFRGIYLEGTKATGGHLVESIEARDCTFLGIQVKGNGSIVRNNFVNVVGRDGGATSFTAIRYGMDILGDGVLVQNNHVFNVFINAGGTTAIGIFMRDSDSAVVERNRVINTDDAFSLFTRGIGFQGSDTCVAAANIVIGYTTGMEFTSSSQTLFRDNTVTRAAARYLNNASTATDGGGNQ